MSGRGNFNITKTKRTLTHRAGLQFPVARIHRYLKVGSYAPRISVGASIYFTAVLEYLTAEILELSANAAKDSKKMRITPRHILLAIRHDDEINTLLQQVTIPQGGVVPYIHSFLFVTKRNPPAPKGEVVPSTSSVNLKKPK
ncbi:hypothetical protein OTU49_009791 [Cherax quadricarinatus]|uniref:Histone H2A n=1 Tax=Cherax quadricarinatus TaxID=27406 RepID=A0AAW0WIR7_CHEQU|nr:histone H2A-beta, sperm-like [Cherax quadricarinatus]